MTEFPFIENRPDGVFQFGRISRADAGKYNARQLWIYETMTAPTSKSGLIVGWNDQVEEKLGRPDSYIKTVHEGGMSQQEFYRFSDVVIIAADTFENLPRVGFEAMSSGSVLVVDNRGGWKIQVVDGETGWLCNDDREFVYKASRIAFEKEEREEMRRKARQKLEEEWGIEASVISWERVFEEWEKT
jgi:glycosyltransferase involved in cell wall biosynthesis